MWFHTPCLKQWDTIKNLPAFKSLNLLSWRRKATVSRNSFGNAADTQWSVDILHGVLPSERVLPTYRIIPHIQVVAYYKVQTKVMSIIIPQCGYNSKNTQRSIIYGPHRLGGTGFRHLYTEQGILQIIYFLRHWCVQFQIGKLFRCTISWLQFSIGVFYSVLAQPTTSLPHLELKWVASMRIFLAEQKLTIQLMILESQHCKGNTTLTSWITFWTPTNILRRKSGVWITVNCTLMWWQC